MNKKVLLQDLSERMAQRKNMPKKDADLFVRSVFEIIGEYLQTDKIVKIKGLGTFKLVTVESRASVDVNTGERIVIKGYTKVSFTPDAALRDEINKPFAQFETVILNEGTNVDDMERMDTPEIPDWPESESIGEESEVPVNTEYVPEVNVAPVEAAPRNVESSECENAEELGFETAAIEDEPNEVVLEEQDVKYEEPAAPKEQTESAETESAAHQVEESAAEPPLETEVHVANQQVEFQKVEHQTVENQHIVQVAPGHNECRCALSVWTWICICFAVLLLMCGSYYAGHQHWLCPGDCHETATVPAKDVKVKKSSPEKATKPVVKPTPQPQPETQVNASPDKNQTAITENPKVTYPQVEGGEYEITGTKETHRLKAGETLRGLALKYYGSKDYVEYIIIYNEIKNPDIVPVNMELKLPELKLKRR